MTQVTLKRYNSHIVDEGDGYMYIDGEITEDGYNCSADEAMKIIEPLQADIAAISKILDKVAIEHSGYAAQAPRVQMLVERDAKHVEMIKNQQLRIRELTERLEVLSGKVAVTTYQK